MPKYKIKEDGTFKTREVVLGKLTKMKMKIIGMEETALIPPYTVLVYSLSVFSYNYTRDGLIFLFLMLLMWLCGKGRLRFVCLLMLICPVQSIWEDIASVMLLNYIIVIQRRTSGGSEEDIYKVQVLMSRVCLFSKCTSVFHFIYIVFLPFRRVDDLTSMQLSCHKQNRTR